MSPPLGCSVHSRQLSTSAAAPHSTLAGSLSVDRGSLAQKGLLGSEDSWPCMGTVRTLALARGGMQSTDAAGKSPGRWRCEA